MNILFVNYGDFRSNSLNHIAPFANALVELGHNCVIAVPKNLKSSECIPRRLFSYGTYEDVLTSPYHFINAEPADVIHAWTPRIGVASFVSRYVARYPTPAVVTHLEDDEETLLEDIYAVPFRELVTMKSPPSGISWVSELSHPLQHKAFMALSDAVTVINDKLLTFAPQDRPGMELRPGLEPPPSTLSSSTHLRSTCGLSKDDRLIVYPGGITASNIDDIVELIEAIRMLRERAALRIRLVKTGSTSPALADRCSGATDSFVIDLGFINKSEVFAWLEAADLLVQPGHDNRFNRYRLPSKLPEFLSSGKPVIAPAISLEGQLVDGENALLLYSGCREEIAEKIAWLIEHPNQARAIGAKGRKLARSIFCLESNTRKLLQFYEGVIESPIRTWKPSYRASSPFRKALLTRIRRSQFGAYGKLAPCDLSDYLRSTHLQETDRGWLDSRFRFRLRRTTYHYLIRWEASLPRRFRKTSDPPKHIGLSLDAPQQPLEPKPDNPQTLAAHSFVPLAERDESGGSPNPRPKISVLLPVHRTHISLLSAAISSVQMQTYQHWEMCIVDDASEDPNIRALLLNAQSRDERIQVSFRAVNGHICRASNDALDMATGEFVALLDHDDILSPHALASVAQAIKAHPQAKIIYTDEDKIDASGHHSEPHFKSDWNPDLLLSQNYMGHLSIFRTATAQGVGGFRPGFEGSQDWDLLLRVSRICDDREIVHIPQVLYHWRQVPGSTALQSSAKSYAFDSAKRALSSYLGASANSIKLEPVNQLYWRMKYTRPRLAGSFCIVSFGANNRFAQAALESDLYPATSRSDVHFCHVRSDLSNSHNCIQSVLQGINNAIADANSENILIVDALLRPYNEEWLDEISAQCARLDIGIVGPKLLNPDKSVNHAFQTLDADDGVRRVFERLGDEDDGYFHKAHLTSNVTVLSLHAMAFRRSVWEEIGTIGLPSEASARAGISFCLRSIEAGYRNLFTPFSKLIYSAPPPEPGGTIQ